MQEEMRQSFCAELFLSMIQIGGNSLKYRGPCSASSGKVWIFFNTSPQVSIWPWLHLLQHSTPDHQEHTAARHPHFVGFGCIQSTSRSNPGSSPGIKVMLENANAWHAGWKIKRPKAVSGLQPNAGNITRRLARSLLEH